MRLYDTHSTDNNIIHTHLPCMFALNPTLQPTGSPMIGQLLKLQELLLRNTAVRIVGSPTAHICLHNQRVAQHEH